MEINIEEYYTRYGPMVMRRCRQLLRDEEKALDAMQEVFTKLMISKKRLRGIYPSSLLFRIDPTRILRQGGRQIDRQGSA
jgi:RNA polymerase sigma-70 factor (ECF subfamily)